ncbi:MAG: LPP20 family lipoprotein [Candidatus Cloacimonetes bacterium]|nr:LPP20 family lipoprotein [Candidatus Cloacimonadota bacterium]
MKKNYFIITLFFILIYTMSYAIPNWYTDNYADQFPSYFIGKGYAKIENKNEAEAEKQAKDQALRDASTTISCTVSGETISHSEEEGLGKETKASEFFLSETKVKTDLKVMNYKVLKSEKDKNMMYVMIGIPFEDLRKSYKYKIENAVQNIANEFNIAEDLFSSNPKQAIRKYESCIKKLQDITENMNIYLFLNKWYNDLSSKLDELPSKSQIETKLTTLSGTTPKTSIELATELLAPLLKNLEKQASFVIYPMEFENTGFVSEFGNNFSELLSNVITSQTGWQRFTIKNWKVADYIIRGKILESDNGMYLILNVKDLQNGTEDSNQLFVNTITCETIGWEKIRPENLKQALQNKLALYNAIQTDNRLKVDMQTDKMSDGPVVYYYGDEPKILVRANKSCYIRLMYIFSDNTKTLLIDNYHIATDQTNQWIQLPLDLEVCEPSGVEQMLVQASTEIMPSLNVKRINLGDDSYIYIIETNIDNQIAKTRGLKIKNPKKEITERSYQWTVFEK